MIRKRGNKWLVLDSAGKRVLGRHDTKREAQEQLAAIEASKRRKGKRKGGI